MAKSQIGFVQAFRCAPALGPPTNASDFASSGLMEPCHVAYEATALSIDVALMGLVPPEELMLISLLEVRCFAAVCCSALAVPLIAPYEALASTLIRLVDSCDTLL